MDWFTLLAAAFAIAFALPVLLLLTALLPKLPGWIPGAVALTAAIVLVARNTLPEHHAEPPIGAYAELGFEAQNGVALGLAIVGAIGLAAWLRSRYRLQTSEPAVELPTAVVKHDLSKI